MRNFILFKEDWGKFPSAVVDVNTRNKTFLRQAEAYQRMGVNNCEFILALLNPALSGIDPFDKGLSKETKEAIALEAYMNPWYYFREIAKIEPKGGGGSVINLIANRSIICLLWCTLNQLNIFLVQLRQSGKSVGTDFMSNYITHIAGRKNAISILTKDDDLRAEQIERLKGLRDLLPDYLNPYRKNMDGDPRERLSCDRWNNTINTAVPRSSEQQARNVGRGMTSPIALIDEGPFIRHIGVIVRAMLGSTSTARRIARENGEFNFTAFTTTAGDRVDPSGAYIHSLMTGGLQFDERAFFDSENAVKLHEMVKVARKGPMACVAATFTYDQLGMSDADLEELMTNNAAEGDDADRDYFSIWTNGGLTSPIHESIKQAMIQNIKEPVYTEVDEKLGYVIRWYITEREARDGARNRRIVIGQDSSDAVGNDSLTLVFTDADTGEIIGASDVNEANLFNYGLYLARTIARFKLAVIIPERRGGGTAFIDSLIVNLPKYGLDPLRVIYNTIAEDLWYETKDFFKQALLDPLDRPDSFYEIAKRYMGFVTSAKGRHSRTDLFNRILLMATKSTHRNTNDRKLIDQLLGLVIRNGRLDHANGKHDDLVIAYLLVFWFLTSTPNLEWYGLGRPLLRAEPFELTVTKEVKTEFDNFLDEQQNYYRQQLEQLLIDLENTNDNLIAMRIETKLDAIANKIRDDSGQSSTYDEMIANAKENRLETLKQQAREASKTKVDYSKHPSFRRW